jgi:hypothetical protein
VAGTNTVPSQDWRRIGVVPRTAPSFREERITRARCAASSLLVVGGGRWAVVFVGAMMDEGVIEGIESKRQRSVARVRM